jgi:hypothetical protein
MASEYALPLMLEAALILLFGLMGAQLARFEGLTVPFTIVLLCFVMGLQNAMVTKLSGGVVRTTHLTGTVTDLGIELGKLVYWNRVREAPRRPARVIPPGGDRRRVRLPTRRLHLHRADRARPDCARGRAGGGRPASRGGALSGIDRHGGARWQESPRRRAGRWRPAARAVIGSTLFRASGSNRPVR